MNISLLPVADAVAALRAFDGVEVAGLSETDLLTVRDAVARLQRVVEVPAAVVAGEIARRSAPDVGTGLARRHGHRNPVQMVAHGTGGSRAGAHDLIAAGELVGPPGTGRHPCVAEAFSAGDLSAAKVSLLARTLDQLAGDGDVAVPRAEIERRLVAKARRVSLEELRKACAQVVARWNLDRTAEREARMRSERYLALTEQADGMVRVSGLLDPASAAPVIAWLDAQVRDGFARKRDGGDTSKDPREAGWLRVDALAGLARHGSRCDAPGTGVSTTVVVRLSEEALGTGLGLGECDQLSTPLTAGQLRRMAVDAEVIPAVLGGESLPLDLGRGRRYFTRAQRIALVERDGGCAFCHAPAAWCDAHHVDEWKAKRGRTDLDRGVLLCTRCHHRIHDDGWEVKVTRDRVWFVPPPDVDLAREPRLGGRGALELAA
ncbi:HNH endonuclease [Demequina iriomotensis]|uniref:HNH endonuclease n=1 Tax=Demequina iriomotensis TaxID=1536641 RepID=UPI0007840ABF|nr:HNH endonuclease signature motif containing protein [Demequina iriomotensis]